MRSKRDEEVLAAMTAVSSKQRNHRLMNAHEGFTTPGTIACTCRNACRCHGTSLTPQLELPTQSGKQDTQRTWAIPGQQPVNPGRIRPGDDLDRIHRQEAVLGGDHLPKGRSGIPVHRVRPRTMRHSTAELLHGLRIFGGHPLRGADVSGYDAGIDDVPYSDGCCNPWASLHFEYSKNIVDPDYRLAVLAAERRRLEFGAHAGVIVRRGLSGASGARPHIIPNGFSSSATLPRDRSFGIGRTRHGRWESMEFPEDRIYAFRYTAILLHSCCYESRSLLVSINHGEGAGFVPDNNSPSQTRPPRPIQRVAMLVSAFNLQAEVLAQGRAPSGACFLALTDTVVIRGPYRRHLESGQSLRFRVDAIVTFPFPCRVKIKLAKILTLQPLVQNGFVTNIVPTVHVIQ